MTVATLSVSRDRSGVAVDVIPFSGNPVQLKLAADTDTTVTVPSGCNRLLASCPVPGDEAHISNSSITFATDATPVTTGGEPLPCGRVVVAADTLHLRSISGAMVDLLFYAA